MSAYSLLEQGDLVQHKDIGCLGIIIKVFPFSTHYDRRIYIQWNDDTRCFTNVHLLRKITKK